MVQSPESCAFDGMPLAAVATGAPVFSLDPSALAQKVASLLAHPLMRAALTNGEEGKDVSIEPYQAIIRLLKDTTEYDLSNYKAPTIVRRIERRMTLRSLDSVEEYLKVLQRDTDEVGALATDCFIHVTRFFRDLQAYWALRQHLLTLIVKFHDRVDPLRVWVAGCSTGEEAYSVAALLDRSLKELGAKFDFKMFATDIVDSTLSIASAGSYSSYVEADIPKNYLKGLVVREDENLRVLPAIRSRIVFTRHDLLRDPPFPRADIIVCRNLLIYLQTDAQKIALERFHYSLRRGGVLFLGPSESIDGMESDFDVLNSKWKLYAKKTDSRVPTRSLGMPRFSPGRPHQAKAATQAVEAHPLIRTTETLIQLFAEAGVIVSESGEVQYCFGEVSKWLRMPKGPVSIDLRDLLPPQVVPALLLGLRQARTTSDVIHITRIPRSDGTGEDVSVDLLHVKGEESRPNLDVILIGGRTISSTTVPSSVLEVNEMTQAHVAALERELHSTRESLQTSVEELQTTNEELQSVNEELLASNEELQSTNQELHSVNEELYSVNSEHQDKIAELAQVRDDLQALLRTTEIGTLFLDSDLRVRRFTPSVEIVIPLREQDHGRPIYEMVSYLEGVNLAELAGEVRTQGRLVERQSRTKRGTVVLVRGHPIAPLNEGPSGVVFTFIDITNVDRSFSVDDLDRRSIEAVLRSSKDVLWIANPVSRMHIYLSPAFDGIWGRSRSTFKSDPMAWFDSIHPDDRDRVDKDLAARSDGREDDLEYRILRPSGEARTIRDRSFGKLSSENASGLIYGVIEDITAQRAIEKQRRRTMEIHRLAGERARVPMFLLGLDGAILWSNNAARRALGWQDVAWPPELRDLLASDEDIRVWMDVSSQVLSSEMGDMSVFLQMKTRAGVSIPCDLEVAYSSDGSPESGLLVCQWVDVSEQVRRERELSSKAETFEAEANLDPLTGLYNRRGLERLLHQQFLLAQRSYDPMMVLLIDCDCFKEINDHYGHSAGDTVLTEIARRLRSTLRPSDLLARVGGDEFLAILPGSRLAEGAHVGEKLRRAIAGSPVAYREQAIKVTISLGVVAAPAREVTVQELFEIASKVLKQSKQSGRDRVSYSDMDGTSGTLNGMDSELERILSGQIRVVGQKINDVVSGDVVGVELLCRGTAALKSPVSFFEAARRADCLEEVDLACLNRSVARALELNGALDYHINVYPTTLLDNHRASFDAILNRVPIPAHFCIELSEQQFVGTSVVIRNRMEELRKLGFRIALDDIGFGHSSLETLLGIAPDIVKIDRAMIAEIDRDAGARRILERLATLLQGPRAEVIAEGVERESQRRVLADLGIRRAQGFLWSRPDEQE